MPRHREGEAPDKAGIVGRICEGMANGELARDLIAAEGIDRSTLWDWTQKEPYATLYARARVQQSHALAERCVAIAEGTDTEGQDRLEALVCQAASIEDDDARDAVIAALAREQVQRDRLRVDTLKWLTSKIAPKLYGESAKLEVEHSGGLTVTIRREGRRIERPPVGK